MGIMEPIKQIIYAIIGAGSNSSQKIIEASGEYLASVALDEDVSISREKAQIDAMKNATKLAESLVVEIARVRKKRISHDRIKTIAKMVVKLQGDPVFDLQPTEDEKMTRYICRLKVSVKDGAIIGKLRQDPSNIDETARQFFEFDIMHERISKKMKELQTKIESAESDIDRENVREERKKLDSIFNATKFFQIGYQLIDAKKYPEAVENFSKAIELHSNYSFAYNGRGIANRLLRKADLAMSDFDQSVNIEPNYISAYINRGIMFSELKRFDLAISDYDRAIFLNVKNANTYYNRGIAYEAIGKKSEAIADFQKVLELNPDHDGAKSHLSKLHK